MVTAPAWMTGIGAFMIFLSIVIPVFNVESYLGECLDSVLALAAEDIEIILVLGNSTDNSNAICEKYAEEFARIRIVFQDGAGLSDARNCAFGHIRGSYVAYFDSDDYILTERFEETLLKIRAAQDSPIPVDVFVSDYFAIAASGAILYESNQISTREDRGQDFFKKRRGFWNVWRYVYRRDFLLEQGLLFKDTSSSEDLDFTTRVFLSAANARFFHNPYYCYRINRAGSLANETSLKSINDGVEVIEDCIKRVLADAKFAHKRAYCRHILLNYILGIVGVSEVNVCEKAQAVAVIRRTLYLLNTVDYPLAKICSGVISLMGVANFSRALGILKKTRRAARKLKI
jgi:glycosyltransferase involved in cell wall biosynthesis